MGFRQNSYRLLTLLLLKYFWLNYDPRGARRTMKPNGHSILPSGSKNIFPSNHIYIWLFYAFYPEFWKVLLKGIKWFLSCSRENILCSDKVNTSTSVFKMINPYYLILHYWEVVLPWSSGHLGCQNCWGTSGSCLGMYGPHPDADLQHRPSQIQAPVYR